MIKLERNSKPAYLSDVKVAELTNKFKANQKETVWKHPDIHKALLLSSASKCAFCETPLQVSASYMEIEHFKDKDTYKNDVVNWENLLPSCKRCNTTKGTHDVVSEPIINPFEVEPKHHLSHSACRVYSKSELGESTRAVLNLNDEKLVYPRYQVWNFVVSSIESIHFDIVNKTKLTRHDRNKLASLLTSCQSNRAFSAFASAALHQSVEYPLTVSILKSNALWDANIDLLHVNSLKLVLDRR